MLRFIIAIIVIFSFYLNTNAQENSDLQIKNYQKKGDYYINPLSPAKAAFYSAILPGLGQAYNKKYLKIPIIYAALGTSIYFYTKSNKDYNRVFDALKLELQGKPHEFENLDVDALESAISRFKKNRDLALFISLGLYALNILEANVDAHLPDGKIDSNLSFKPKLFVSPITNKVNYGVGLTINF